MSRLKKSTILLVLFVLANCFISVARADGSVDFDTVVFSYDQNTVKKYAVFSHMENQGAEVSGYVEITPSDGRFDSRGESYHICFLSYASFLKRDENGNYEPGEFKPVKNTFSASFDERDGAARFDVVGTKYDKMVSCYGGLLYIWRMEADGDYNIIGAMASSDFFLNMAQYYGY